mgnify:CR=1 FL=1
MRAFSKGKLARKEDEIYHFLLPDKNMVPSAGIKLLKKDYENEAKRVSTWKSEFIKPIRGDEYIFLLNICKKIDELLERVVENIAYVPSPLKSQIIKVVGYLIPTKNSVIEF